MQYSESPLGKPWAEITREERYFCAELFFEIRKDTKKFIQFLNSNPTFNLNIDEEWEIGFEVCFYRDFLYSIGKSVKVEYNEIKFPQKRTFDLCLFSQSTIVIIEAKVFENFDDKQLNSLDKDVFEKRVIKVLSSENSGLNIIGILIHSSKKKIIKSRLSDKFEKFTWENLYKYYNNEVFRNADLLPKKITKIK